MPDHQKQNRRNKVRVDFTAQIVLKVGQEEICLDGSSENLSLSGIFVNIPQDFPIGQKCKIEVLLSGVTEKVALEMEGSIVRKDRNGIAIAFDSMDLDSYSRLKNIVRYNSLDSDN